MLFCWQLRLTCPFFLIRDCSFLLIWCSMLVSPRNIKRQCQARKKNWHQNNTITIDHLNSRTVLYMFDTPKQRESIQLLTCINEYMYTYCQVKWLFCVHTNHRYGHRAAEHKLVNHHGVKPQSGWVICAIPINDVSMKMIELLALGFLHKIFAYNSHWFSEFLSTPKS